MLTWVAAVVLCVLTTAVYPVHYDALLTVGDDTPRAIALQTARNAALVAFVGWTAALAWVTTRRAQQDRLSRQALRAAEVDGTVEPE